MEKWGWEGKTVTVLEKSGRVPYYRSFFTGEGKR